MDQKPEAVWDDEQPEELNKDTKIHLDHLFQDGFRTGVAQGQEEKVQEGFDIGYGQGMQEGIAWGRLQGILTTYKALKSQMDDVPVTEKLNAASERIAGVSGADAYVHSFNKLTAAQASELSKDKGFSVLPQTIEGGPDIGERLTDAERIINQSKL